MTAILRRVLLAASFLCVAVRGEAADGFWTQLAPPALGSTISIYDPVRDRLVLFGGTDGGRLRNEVWILDAAGTSPWRTLTVTGTPPFRTPEPGAPVRSLTLSGGCYDSARDRLLVFGERDLAGTLATTVYALSLSSTPQWTVVTASGTPPSPRHGCSVVYDPVDDRLVMYGGFGPHPTLGDVTWNEVWALSLGGTPTWSQLSPGGTLPPRRFDAGTVYDPSGHRLIVFGGRQSPSFNDLNDLWALSLSPSSLAWAPIAASNLPAARARASMFVDAVAGTIWIQGGGAQFAIKTDFWKVPLIGGSWTQVSFDALPGSGGAAWHDLQRNRFVLHGGWRSDTSWPLDNTWTLDPLVASPTWTSLGPPVQGSGPRGRASIFNDVARDRMLVFGGLAPSASDPEPPLEFDRSGAGSWSAYVPSGSSPWLPVALDPARGQLLAVNGIQSGCQVLDLSFDVWSPRPTSNAPGQAVLAGVVDSLDDRFLVFCNGAEPDFGTPITAVWALPLAELNPSWTKVAQVVGAPPPDAGKVAIFDPPGHRVLWFGNGAQVWALHLGGAPSWEHLPNFPISIYGPQASYDAANHRIILFYADQQYVGETFVYSWDLSQPGTAAVRLFPSGSPQPIRGRNWSGGFDSRRGQLFLLGGADGMWVLSGGAAPPVGVEPVGVELGLDLRAFPTPSHSSVRFSWRLPRASRMALFVTDLRGRRVRTLVSEESATAGEHLASWDGTDDRGSRVPAGVYFGALRVEGRLETRRLVLLDGR